MSIADNCALFWIVITFGAPQAQGHFLIWVKFYDGP